jgi:TetR/AcrR family transcriptional regulator, cholesterol catabolism regulator
LETLEKILVKAEELFFTYGVKNTTMDDLSRSLGASKKTLYQFVTDKADLVSRAMEHHIKQEHTHIDAIVQQAPNAIEELLSIARHVTGHMKGINPAIVSDMQRFYPAAWQLFTDYKMTFIYNTMLNNMKRGMKEGLYRSDINPDILSKIYIARMDLIIDQKLFPFAKYDFVSVYRETLNYHLHGISSSKGQAYLEKKKILE